MRVFILERTPLSMAHRLKSPPQSDDVIAWLRTGQDCDGAGAAALEGHGIRTISAESLVDNETGARIDLMGEDYLRSWYLDARTEVGRIGEFSLGRSFGLDLARQANPRYLIRTGEIVRRVIEAYPQASSFVTDLADGHGIIRTRAAFQPMARIAHHVAATLDRDLTVVDAVAPMPPDLVRGRRRSFATILRSYAGGFRPTCLRARWHWLARGRRERTRPRIYVFVGRGLDLVARRLAANGRFQVLTSQPGIPSIEVLRHDQLLALPSFSELRVAFALLRHARGLATRREHAGALCLNGVSYGPIVARAFATLLGGELWPVLVIFAQARKLQRLAGFAALIINGAGNEPMGMLMTLNRATGRRIYVVPHGANVHRSAACEPLVDQSHVVYLMPGDAHRDDFCLGLPETKRPLRQATGSPLVAALAAIRGRRAARHGRRLLLLSFGQVDFWNAARIRACDRYYVETFRVARDLAREGWTISCRAHPGHSQALERRIAAALGLDDVIAWDSHDSLDDALLAHDVVVSNLSSAYYQSLYAGWPTIFYEPDYAEAGDLSGIEADPMLTGLPTARDIDRPVTNDPATLARLIRETLDPKSPTSTFPEKFAGPLAERFIGPRATDADLAIAEFIERDFFAVSGPPAAKTQTTPLDPITERVMA